MENKLLNESFIRYRSEELQIPFENLLAALVLEEIVKKIAESDCKDMLWLKNSMGLNLDNYRKKVDLNLSYDIKESKKLHYNKEDIRNVFDNIFRNLKHETIQWNFKIIEESSIIYVNMTAVISKIEVPAKIIFGKIIDETIHPNTKNIRLFTNNNQKIPVKCFPCEYVIAEKFLDILEKLELINDLSGYMEIYEILKKENVSGRKVWELLSKGCRDHEIQMDEERFLLIVSYRTNRFMKKKWKAYLRHKKRKGPAWEEVICMFEVFFTNIWKSMCTNIIYLGDWMPELGRFID